MLGVEPANESHHDGNNRGLHTKESKAVAASVRKLMREARDLIRYALEHTSARLWLTPASEHCDIRQLGPILGGGLNRRLNER